jgi:hypothetical protein
MQKGIGGDRAGFRVPGHSVPETDVKHISGNHARSRCANGALDDLRRALASRFRDVRVGRMGRVARVSAKATTA